MANSRPTLAPPIGDRDYIRGPLDAAITLVEYGDYECPFCSAAYAIVKEVLERMGDRVLFAYRHFPLTQVHPHAELAAEAAESVGAQGRFWEMHDLLFEHQRSLDERKILRLAEMAGADIEQVARDLAGQAYRERVREDFMSGVRSGVNGTPNFFINGYRHDGSWDRAPLMQALERASRGAPAVAIPIR